MESMTVIYWVGQMVAEWVGKMVEWSAEWLVDAKD